MDYTKQSASRPAPLSEATCPAAPRETISSWPVRRAWWWDAQGVSLDQESSTSYLVAAASPDSGALQERTHRSAQAVLARCTAGKRMNAHICTPWRGSGVTSQRTSPIMIHLTKLSIATFPMWDNPNPLHPSQQQHSFCSSPYARQNLPPEAGRTTGTTTPLQIITCPIAPHHQTSSRAITPPKIPNPPLS